MEATNKGPLGSQRINMAADLFWFGVVSVVAGLCAAVTVAAMAMLLAQPAHAQAENAFTPGAAGSGHLMVKGEEPGLYRPLPTLRTDVAIRAWPVYEFVRGELARREKATYRFRTNAQVEIRRSKIACTKAGERVVRTHRQVLDLKRLRNDPLSRPFEP